ncbi:MAG: hypothetical protein M5T52_06455 [Ignavibacteriaceae bacterium]|nr:hypothetical protein [Ignavibacteriaceae bacterium]
MKDLFHLRNQYPSLSKGKLRHIYPFDDIYILIKSYDDEMTMVVINARGEDFSFESLQLKSFCPKQMK